MPKITKLCETCGEEFTRWKVPSKVEPRYCSQKCWLSKHNNPERNAKVARETAEKRGDKLRGRKPNISVNKIHKPKMDSNVGKGNPNYKTGNHTKGGGPQ